MPTPSNNGPDPQSPRSYHPFSTCPDVDELAAQAQPQPQSQARVHSPSSWHPHPPTPYEQAAVGDSVTSATAIDSDGNNTDNSRSATASPRPSQLRRDGREPDGPVDDEMLVDDRGTPADDGDGSGDYGPKTGDDADEEMLAVEEGGGVDIRSGGGGMIQDGLAVTARRAGAAHHAGDSIMSRLRRLRAAAGASSSTSSSSSPDITSVEAAAEDGRPWAEDTGMLGMGYEYADARVIPLAPSSFLRAGSRFHGTQQSERQRYDVQVEIKHVDLRESFLCGYLRIQGLTEDHPTLTTYFEGEIIGSKYDFITQHPSWGASDKIDLSHWAKFTAFRPYTKQARKGGRVQIRNVAQCENIFMRWKEHFLVPDHRVRTINGASFEGFYYICFNQVRGEVSGIYFHSKSEKFQQLELKHVEDKGCYGAMEFR